MGKVFRFSEVKNQQLKVLRGVTFEDLLAAEYLETREHARYKHQKVMFVQYRQYVWVIPFVEEKDYFFLKTAYPSRKYTKIFLGGE